MVHARRARVRREFDAHSPAGRPRRAVGRACFAPRNLSRGARARGCKLRRDLGRQRLFLLLAVLGLCGAIAFNGRYAVRWGLDFASLYEMGHGVLTGTNVYDPAAAQQFPAKYDVMVPAGMFYPPATGFSMLPFAALPYRIGRLAWLAVIDLVLILGVRNLFRALAPSRPSYVWVSCAAVILVSSALRWALILLQGAPLVFGLLCLFIAALHEGKTRLATVLAIIAVAAKMTLALPFLGILLLQRRFAALIASGGTWVLLNVLGFWRMGPGSYHEYQGSVGKLEAFGDINSPDPWALTSNPRLDWTSLFYGITHHLPVARLGTLACAGLVALWLVREGWRAADPRGLRSMALFLAPLVCLGSLCVYHHHYDSTLFFAPVLVLALVFDRRQLGRAAWLLEPFFLMMLLLPVGAVQDALQALLGDTGVGLLKLSFPVAVSLALIGSLIVLHTGERDRIEPKLE